MYVCTMIAKNIPELKNGYRMVMNNGKDARQEVYHIHLHVVGGARLTPARYVKHTLKKVDSTGSNSDNSSIVHEGGSEAYST